VMGYPYFNVFTDATGILGYFILSPLVILTFIILFIKQRKVDANIKFIMFSFTMIINGLYSLLLTRSGEKNFISLAMLMMGLFIVFTIINAVRDDKENLFILNQAFVFAVVAVFFSNLLTGNLFEVGRLSI